MDTTHSLNIAYVDADGDQVALQTFPGDLGFVFTPSLVSGASRSPVVVTQDPAQLEFPFVQAIAH